MTSELRLRKIFSIDKHQLKKLLILNLMRHSGGLLNGFSLIVIKDFPKEKDRNLKLDIDLI